MVMPPYAVEFRRQPMPSYRPIRQRVHRPGDIIMIIKSYFDGTGGSDTKLIGLASIAAPIAAWEVFESEWKVVLEHFQACSLHMKDLNVARKAFKGWEIDRRFAFLNELLAVLYHLLRTPHVCPRMTLISVDAHTSAKEHYPGMIPSIPCLCAFWCLDQMCNAYPVTDHFEMVFDRGEQFFRHIDHHWRKRAFANNHKMLSRIKSLDLNDATRLLPLQAADLFAWEIQRYWRTWDTLRYMKFPAFGGIEAELLLLFTQNKRWEYDDLEYLAQCRASSSESVRQEVEKYSLCR